MFFPKKRKTKLVTFNITLKLNSLVLLKKIKNCIPSHLFLDIWLQRLSSCYISLIDWLTTFFVNPWKNQKYLFIINLFTFLLQIKLFLRNNIAFAKKCTVEESISCRIFFLRLCCWRNRATVWRSSGKYILLYDEKGL